MNIVVIWVDSLGMQRDAEYENVWVEVGHAGTLSIRKNSSTDPFCRAVAGYGRDQWVRWYQTRQTP
jgi:hypothetical protein